MFRWCYLLSALIFTLKFSQTNSQTCGVDQCSKSSFPDSLIITPDKECYDLNDEVALNCSGKMGGPPSNTCNGGDNQGWQFPSPTCEVFTCNRSVPIDDALNLSPDKSIYDARETVNYNCDDGYEMLGPDQATCDDQDEWNPPTVPVCSDVCDVPTIPHGNVTAQGPFLDGDVTEVECDDGYTLESGSSSAITCQDGVWDNIPQCFASCDVPDVSYGEIITSGPFVHGQTAEVNCDEGYTMDGASEFTITCQDGDWDPVPVCYASCDVPDVSYGEIITSGPFVHGQTAEVNCDEGYTMDGASEFTITCQDGDWDPVPVCYGSCYVSVIPNSDAETERQLDHGAELSVHCDIGYSYEQQTTFNFICNNGTLEGDFPEECLKDCEEPTPPQDGFVTTGNRHGETIFYQCKEGFALNGIDSATCTDGTWSNEAPTCHEIISTCEAPADVGEELILTPEKTIYNANEVVTYSCPEGKTLKGSEEATCSKSGEWQPPDPPVCHGVMIRGSSLIILIFSSLLALYSS